MSKPLRSGGWAGPMTTAVNIALLTLILATAGVAFAARMLGL